MSDHLPVVSCEEAIRAFARYGFVELAGRGKGHAILSKQGRAVHLSVPRHRELKRGLLRSLIRRAGLTVAEFRDAL